MTDSIHKWYEAEKREENNIASWYRVAVVREFSDYCRWLDDGGCLNPNDDDLARDLETALALGPRRLNLTALLSWHYKDALTEACRWQDDGGFVPENE